MAETYTVDAVAWEEFLSDYERYTSGNPKMPFSELRLSLSAVIESASTRPDQPQEDFESERASWRKLTEELKAELECANKLLREWEEEAGKIDDFRKALADAARLRAALAELLKAAQAVTNCSGSLRTEYRNLDSAIIACGIVLAESTTTVEEPG